MENNSQEKLISSIAPMEAGSANTTINPKVTVNLAKSFGGESSDEGFGVDVDKEGNIYITGSFEDSVSFGDDITLESNGRSDAIVAKLDCFVMLICDS